MRKKPQAIGVRRGGRSRSELVADMLRVASSLEQATATVAEVAKATCIHPRTVYRILESLPSLGFDIEVMEEDRDHGPGRRIRRYRATRRLAAVAG